MSWSEPGSNIHCSRRNLVICKLELLNKAQLSKMVKSQSDREHDQKKRLLEGLLCLYQERKLTDVILVVDEREFHCNKNVLAASSPYFRAMFTSNVQEMTQEKICLYDVSTDAMESILNFMYSGLIYVGPENAQDIFMASNLFELLDLVDCCIEYMIGQLHIANCVEMLNFARYHHCENLRIACKSFILQHFTGVSATDEFLNIDAVTIEEFLECDDIYVKTEDFVFDVIEKWVNYDFEKRKTFFPRLFHKVRLPLVSSEFFQERILSSMLVKDNPFCLNLTEEFLNSAPNCGFGSSEQLLATPIKQRSGMMCKDLIIFSGGSYGVDERSFTAYDPVSRKNYYGLKHHPTFDLKYKIDFFKLVTLNESDVYFIGGIFHENYRFSESGEALKKCYKYDQRLSFWVACEDMITSRCIFSACAHGNSIYVCGGKTTYPTGNPLDLIEVYNTELGYWRSLEQMPLKLYHHSSVAVNGCIYIFGGKDIVDEISDIVLRYDIQTETWFTVDTKLINPRFEHSAIAINSEIYLVGGMTRSSYAVSVQIFNVDNNRWRYGADFPDERKATAVTHIKDKIYVCGGVRQFYRRSKPTRVVESKDLYSYDLNSDSWWKVSRMVQYANPMECTHAYINITFLHDSGFVSAEGEG